MEMIGRYRITGRIGSGSFATVYQGQDDTLDVPVAVKVLADNWATNDDVRARFLAEARLLRRLSDERVVRVFVTEQGRELEPRAAAVRARVEAATGLSPAEFVQLRSMLHRLRSTVVAALPEL